MNMRIVIEESIKENKEMTVNDLIGKYYAEDMVFKTNETKKNKDEAMESLAKYDADELLVNILRDFI